MEKINILDVNINKITQEQALIKVSEFLNSNEKKYIVTPNPEFLMAAQNDKPFRDILNNADMAIPDGAGLLWAATLLNEPNPNKKLSKSYVYSKALFCGLSMLAYPEICKKIIPERVTGTDLVREISKLCEHNNCSIYFLGAEEGIAEACALKLAKQFPNLNVAGTYNGLSGNEDSDKKNILKINKAKPDILFVAYGAPKQEKWIHRNLHKLETVKVAMGVGGAFDFITKKAKRAPMSARKLNLEWLWRLITEPKRVKRIITATWTFGNQVIKYKIENSNN